MNSSNEVWACRRLRIKAMIYLTILLFVKEGKEGVFEEYEGAVLPLMKDFGGEILYRIRPEKSNYIAAQKEVPFEVH